MKNEEDETFRILKRPAYTELRDIIQSWMDDPNDKRPAKDLLRDNMWTIDEFNEYRRRHLVNGVY